MRRAVAPKGAGLDVDLDELGVRVDERAVLRRPVVQAGAERDDEIGAAEDLGCLWRGKATRDADGVGETREQAVGRGRGREDSADLLCQGGEFSAGVRNDRATAGDDGRPAGIGDERGGFGDRFLCRGGRPDGWSVLGRLPVSRGRRHRWLRLDVDGEHENHGAALSVGALIGALGVGCGRVRAVEPLGDRAHGLDQVVLIDPEVAGQCRRRRLAGQDQHRRPALRRLGQPGHRVGQAGTLMHAAHREAPGDAREPVRHGYCPALVAGVVKAGATLCERIRDDKVAAAENAEGVSDTQAGDRGADGVGYGGGWRALSHWRACYCVEVYGSRRAGTPSPAA